jgi:hypothetical protein
MKESLRKKTIQQDDAIRTVTNSQVLHVPQNTNVNYKAPFADIGSDVYWYVSGSKDEHLYADRRVAVFGGDVVISGSLKVEGCELTGSFNFDCDTLELTGSIEVEGFGIFTSGITGSLTTLPDGNPYIVTNSPGLTISTGSNGQIVFSATSGIRWNEKLTGEANGINSDFSLAYYPSSAEALMVFVNGVLQEEGVTADFTLSGSTISFSEPPRVGSKIVATYSKF